METPISSSPRSSAGADETFSVPVPHRWVLQRLLPLWAHPLLPAPPDQNMGKRNQQGIPTWGNGKWIKKDSFSQPTSWFHGQQDKSIQKCGSVPLSKSTVIMPRTYNGLLPVVTHQQQNGNIIPSFISNTQPWFLGAVEWTGAPAIYNATAQQTLRPTDDSPPALARQPPEHQSLHRFSWRHWKHQVTICWPPASGVPMGHGWGRDWFKKSSGITG